MITELDSYCGGLKLQINTKGKLKMLKFSETIKAKPVRKDAVLNAIEKSVARSAWAKGVRNYACDLISDFDVDTNFNRVTEKDLLNGAANWKQYSWDGFSYCYNSQICEMLCTPTEKKRTKGGALPPNKQEDWLDVQARALFQASCLVLQTIEDLKQK